MPRPILASVLAPLVALAAFGPTPAAAQRTWMQDAEIRAQLTNVKLEGVYPSKVAWSERILPDGTTDYVERNERRPGRWNVVGELFCFEYAHANQGGCFRVIRHSGNCYEIYTASIGGIAPSPPPPAAAMSWNGRMWREGEPNTCDERPIS
jgi:hypothetical protein